MNSNYVATECFNGQKKLIFKNNISKNYQVIMTVAAKKNIMKACATRSKKVFCKSTIKRGINSGFYCTKLDCKLKTHSNIGVYLNMPNFMIEIIEDNKEQFDFKFLKNIYRKFSSKMRFDTVEYIDTIKIFLSKIEDASHTVKIVYALYIYKLLDTYSMNNFVNKHPRFKIAVHNKMCEFQNDRNAISEIHKKFIIYMNKNFETGKKYLSRKKNVLEDISLITSLSEDKNHSHLAVEKNQIQTSRPKRASGNCSVCLKHGVYRKDHRANNSKLCPNFIKA